MTNINWKQRYSHKEWDFGNLNGLHKHMVDEHYLDSDDFPKNSLSFEEAKRMHDNDHSEYDDKSGEYKPDGMIKESE